MRRRRSDIYGASTKIERPINLACYATCFEVGDSVGMRKDGQHGVIISKFGGRYRVRLDDGREVSGGFAGTSLYKLVDRSNEKSGSD